MTFSERFGFSLANEIQLDHMDDKLETRLLNALKREFCYTNMQEREQKSSWIEYIIDKQGDDVEPNIFHDFDYIEESLSRNAVQGKWYLLYEIIEDYIEIRKKQNDESSNLHELKSPDDALNSFEKRINDIMMQEKSGYRLSMGKFVNIVKPLEIESIELAAATPYASVNKAIQKAFQLYASRDTPDYENSIKESISAVEAICCIITQDDTATLGGALKKIETKISIHGALDAAFQKLYGYTSDANGIRHSGIDFQNTPAEDARYMLVSCSAFVNYLSEKYKQSQETL